MTIHMVFISKKYELSGEFVMGCRILAQIVRFQHSMMNLAGVGF
jgi:hypothetical protein